MKKMILLALISLSSTAFANYCEVNMIDIRTNRFITSFSAYDYNDGCKEGMKQCRLEIRQRNLVGRADCVRVTDSYPTPTPNPRPPIPQPQPQPNPWPTPGSSYDARRLLNVGELVYHSNRQVIVIGQSMNGLYAVRTNDVYQTIYQNIRREALAVTNGCNLDLCTNDRVISVNSARYLKIVGLQTNDRFVTQTTDVYQTVQTEIDRNSLAETSGCIQSGWSQICVGNVVLDSSNRYSTVIGVQLDGRIVTETNDVYRTIRTNVDPRNLIITR